MKNFVKKISIILMLIMMFVICFAFIGCEHKKQVNYKFTDETIAKIDDKEFSDMLIKYCNDFYKHFQIECTQKLYIENESISSKIGNEIMAKVNSIAQPYLLNGNTEKAKEILKFYSPFTQLGGIRAQEYLDTKYDWGGENGEMIKTNQSPLTQKYINGINEQFEILKKDYFKK